MTLPPRLPKKKRREQQLRCPAHLAWVRSHYCCVPDCRRQPVVAAHVRTAGKSLKAGDDETISLCATSIDGNMLSEGHHEEQHRLGIPAFERKYRLDMRALAMEFASRSPALKRMRMKEKAA